ncbi:hypothetical protein [Catellatospora sichuanensis]|uniref:hypothetical protein n=1 Tax=Catellatospora sichuanensis TaxID=1969805 RepID=UPI001642BBF4|nr:hypothetical protein [Catellatospora sichuanensis]
MNAPVPPAKIAITVAVTREPGAFDDDGLYSNGRDALLRQVGAHLAPNDAPPTRPGA